MVTPIIKLNIGGRIFEFEQDQLLYMKESVFPDYIASNWKTARKVDDTFFFARDPDLFEPIYKFIMGSIKTLCHPNLGEPFLEELLFWQVFENEIHREFVITETRPIKDETLIPENVKEKGDLVIAKIIQLLKKRRKGEVILIPLIHQLYITGPYPIGVNIHKIFLERHGKKESDFTIEQLNDQTYNYIEKVFEGFILDGPISEFQKLCDAILSYIISQIGNSIISNIFGSANVCSLSNYLIPFIDSCQEKNSVKFVLDKCNSPHFISILSFKI